jgi:hypothetical protein
VNLRLGLIEDAKAWQVRESEVETQIFVPTVIRSPWQKLELAQHSILVSKPNGDTREYATKVSSDTLNEVGYSTSKVSANRHRKRQRDLMIFMIVLRENVKNCHVPVR